METSIYPRSLKRACKKRLIHARWLTFKKTRNISKSFKRRNLWSICNRMEEIIAMTSPVVSNTLMVLVEQHQEGRVKSRMQALKAKLTCSRLSGARLWDQLFKTIKWVPKSSLDNIQISIMLQTLRRQAKLTFQVSFWLAWKVHHTRIIKTLPCIRAQPCCRQWKQCILASTITRLPQPRKPWILTNASLSSRHLTSRSAKRVKILQRKALLPILSQINSIIKISRLSSLLGSWAANNSSSRKCSNNFDSRLVTCKCSNSCSRVSSNIIRRKLPWKASKNSRCTKICQWLSSARTQTTFKALSWTICRQARTAQCKRSLSSRQMT